MYAIVKTGGKQYKVAPGDIIEIEKLDAEAGAKVELDAICVVDGDKVEADPAKAAGTKVGAEVLEQFKGEKQLVFKFKKRKNYKRTKGHRQQLTRVRIEAVGSAKAEKKAAPKKAAPKKDDAAAEAPKKAAAAKAEKATEEKKAPAKKAPAEKAAAKKDEAEKPAAKKAPAKKAAEKEEKEAE